MVGGKNLNLYLGTYLENYCESLRLKVSGFHSSSALHKFFLTGGTDASWQENNTSLLYPWTQNFIKS
jgi:hypothetical protein